MSSKRYAFVPMEEPAPGARHDRKDGKDRKRDRSRDRSRSPRRHKSRRHDGDESPRRGDRRSDTRNDTRSDTRDDPRMSDLRLKSRQQYLAKREAEKLAL